MEWKDKYPRNVKPSYTELLGFLSEPVRALFLQFDEAVRDRCQISNKYHRYLSSVGWVYGYGRSYGCELFTVTIETHCFTAAGISVRDEPSLRTALEKTAQAYDNGFEERYAAICAKRRADQALRSKRRASKEKAERDTLLQSIDPERLNQYKWCKKVARSDLYRLYQSEADGRLDEELLDDIGLTLFLRCKQAREVRACLDKGQMICHHCGAVLYGGRASSTGSFPMKNTDQGRPSFCSCGYAYTYREYRRSCNSANMPGGRAADIFRRYMQQWPLCRAAKDKMLLIDRLVHECHTTLMSGEKGRSVCVNLIEGSKKQITALLVQLAYGGPGR